MAKRKRLTPLGPGTLAPAQTEIEPKALFSATSSRVPIAQVAGDASVTAAFEAVRDELQNAQREGRMVLSLPLEAVKADYLIRDRLVCEDDEMEALKQSIRQRGQQAPIEVSDLGSGTYGLISGWRRLQALAALHEESGGLARYGQIQALLRLPADRPDAYIAMLEENEVRANLSFYERARIVVFSVEAGVFDSDKTALQSLFSTASFAKRSKVKSFMPLVRALDGILRFPAQIPERLGLALSRAITDDPGLATSLKDALQFAPLSSAEEERMLLEVYKKGTAALEAMRLEAEREMESEIKSSLKDAKDPDAEAAEVSLTYTKGRIVLEGNSVDAALKGELEAWLQSRGRY